MPDIAEASAPPKVASGKRFKVRTGCITCKIRKVKCDEVKPACKRCTDTGRVCDGYAPVPAPSSKKSATGQRNVVVQQRRPPQLNPVQAMAKCVFIDVKALKNGFAGEERQWLEYFSVHAGPALSGVFDSSFWSHILPQLSTSQPAIKHALLAVASSHARFKAESENDVESNKSVAVSRDFSLRHYNQAIASLQQHLTKSSGVEVPLICCLLFICLECLYGNRILVLDHLRNGLNILTSVPSQSNGTPYRIDMPSVAQSLHRVFRRLDSQSTLFGKPTSPCFENLELSPTFRVPSSFADFEEAKRVLDVLISSGLNFVRATIDGRFAADEDPMAAPLLQAQLQEQFLLWQKTLDNLINRSETSLSGSSSEKMLRVQYTAIFIFLSTCLEIEETAWDAYLPSFTAIVDWAQSISKPPSFTAQKSTREKSPSPPKASPVFALDMALIPPLFLTAIKCRDPIIRRQAITLMEASPAREGLWDARLHSRVARRVMDVEESSMVLSSPSDFSASSPTLTISSTDSDISISILEERFRVRNADIGEVSEGPERTCNVTFYTAPDGMLEDWVIWEELLQF